MVKSPVQIKQLLDKLVENSVQSIPGCSEEEKFVLDAKAKDFFKVYAGFIKSRM